MVSTRVLLWIVTMLLLKSKKCFNSPIWWVFNCGLLSFHVLRSSIHLSIFFQNIHEFLQTYYGEKVLLNLFITRTISCGIYLNDNKLLNLIIFLKVSVFSISCKKCTWTCSVKIWIFLFITTYWLLHVLYLTFTIKHEFVRFMFISSYVQCYF